MKGSLVNEGCYVKGEVTRSILFSDVVVEEGAQVVDSVVLSNCVIKAGAKVSKAVILEGVTVKEGQEIGQDTDDIIYMVSDKNISKE